MGITTTNLSLSLPTYEDAADIGPINQNFLKLDAKSAQWNTSAHPVTAAITTSGALELSGDLPAEKDGLTMQFLSPAAATDGLQVKFAGEDTLYPILSTSEGKEPISAGAWDSGVPVTLTVSGGICFFKGGGQGFPAGWNEKGQGIAWDNIVKNSPIVQREYGKIEDGLQALPGPDVLPAGIGFGCAFSPNSEYLALAHNNSPFITIYKQAGGKFTKLPNPTVLPANVGMGCAFSPDGNYLAVVHGGAPFLTIYKRAGDTFMKLPNPSVLPADSSYHCSFSPNGEYLAVVHAVTPYLTIYKRSGDVFTKLPNPAQLPYADSYGCAFSPDGEYLAVAHTGSPYITIYKRNGDTFIKLANPSTLPTGQGRSCAFSPDGMYLATVSYSSPYIAIYKRNGDTFNKLSNPNVIPTSYGRDCQFSRDGKYLAVSASSSPWLYLYKREGDTFTKLPDPERLPMITLTSYAFGGIAFSEGDKYLAWGYSVSPYLTIYLNEQKTYIHTLNEMNKEYFSYAPKGKIGVAKEIKAAGEVVKTTLFPALYNLADNG